MLTVSSGVSTSTGKPQSALLTIGQVAHRFNLSHSTIRRATDSGTLEAFTLPSKHRRFSEAQILKWLGQEVEASQEAEKTGSSNGQPSVIFIVCRVSSAKQDKRGDLDRQEQRLRQYANEHYPGVPQVLYRRASSGLNFSCPVFVRLIQDLLNGKCRGGVCLSTYPDRFIRWGRELISTIIRFGGATWVTTEHEEPKDYATELSEDILSLVTVMSMRHYSRRSNLHSKIDISGDIAVLIH